MSIFRRGIETGLTSRAAGHNLRTGYDNRPTIDRNGTAVIHPHIKTNTQTDRGLTA
jgi:hypothetical protein